MESRWIYLAVLASLVAATIATNCYDCKYQTVGGFFGDTNCNEAEDLRLVERENCTGKCYSIEYVSFLGLYVSRGCQEDDDEGGCVDGPWDIANVGSGNKTCCDTDLCNSEIFSSGHANQASFVISCFAAAAILLYNAVL